MVGKRIRVMVCMVCKCGVLELIMFLVFFWLCVVRRWWVVFVCVVLVVFVLIKLCFSLLLIVVSCFL